MSTLLGAVPPQAPPAAELCTCGHPESEHDVVARRYCSATSSADLVRGCICRALAGRLHP
jgi:hypothetical protein